MSLDTLHDLFVRELSDLHSAEQQLLDALPLLAQAATSETLKNLFKQHLAETHGQIQLLGQLFHALDASPGGKTCLGMQGLIAEARELVEEEADPQVLDAGLIVVAQKIEHYEIAGYGSARTFAQRLGYTDAARVIEQILMEESSADNKLTRAAEARVNSQAAHATEASI